MNKLNKKLLCPSMMCADFAKIVTEVATLDKAGIDIYHMDIMDGNFVPNMALGAADFKAIRLLTKKKMDAHLMVQTPQNFIDLFVNLGADIIYIHPEADQIPTATLKKIKDLGAAPGIAVNPGTTVASIEPLLNLIDYILVMTVNPGFAGQPYLDFVNDKIKTLTYLKKKYSYKVVVDGAISPEKITELSILGVDGFVLGTSALFNKDEDYPEIIEKLRTSIEEGKH